MKDGNCQQELDNALQSWKQTRKSSWALSQLCTITHLDGFNDLVRHVARQGKPRRVGEQLHGATKRLLSAFRHAVEV